MFRNCDVEIEYDEETQDYYVVWEPPVAIGSGKTKSEALLDLQQAAHCGVDTVIELKFKDISK
jgi:predicted RNase H-like HicB family nuclease